MLLQRNWPRSNLEQRGFAEREKGKEGEGNRCEIMEIETATGVLKMYGCATQGYNGALNFHGILI